MGNILRPGSAVVLAIGLLAAPCPVARAVEPDVRTYGDPSLRPAVDARLRTIYDAAARPDSPRVSLLTRRNLLSQAHARATEVTGVRVGTLVGRIVANVWTSDGKYSIEYYRGEAGLQLVYETFTYFEETAPRDAWRNFLGLAAWERRSYFDGPRIGYAEARGRQAPAPGADAARLRAQAEDLAGLLAKSVPPRS
jgi:hypothetical protein